MRAEGVGHYTRTGQYLLPALVLAALLSGGCKRPAARMDALILTRSDGSKLELKSGGDDVVLMFLSRRSPPSQALLEAARQVAGTAVGARFIAVFEDRDADAPEKTLSGFEVARDPEKSLAQRYQVSMLPTVIALDRQFRVVLREEGFSILTAGRLAGALAAGGKQP